jgi:hypothetical protein
MIVLVTGEGDRTVKQNAAPSFLSGRECTAQEIQQIQETVRVYWKLSWHELVQTICEHLDSVTPAGRYKVDSCAKALVKLETSGWVQLPSRRVYKEREPEMFPEARSDPQEEIAGTVRDVAPVDLEPVRGKEPLEETLFDFPCGSRP